MTIALLCTIATLGNLYAKQDKIDIVWSEKGVAVKQIASDSLHITTKGGRVTVRNDYKGRELTFTLSGSSNNGSFDYKGKCKAVFEINGLTLNSNDSVPLRLRNSKKCVLKISGKNTIRVSADTLDGALLQSKGKLQIKGDGSLSLTSSTVGCKGIKVSKDLILDGGDVTISTSGMFIERDTTSHFGGPMGPPPGDQMGPPPGMQRGQGPDSMMMGRGFHGRPNFPDSLARKRPDRHGGDFPNGFSGPPEGFFDGNFPMGGPGGGPGGGPDKQKYNGSSKAVRVKGDIIINGGKLSITTAAPGAEGLESKQSITINGGEVIVDAYDDAINSGGKIIFAGGKVRAISHNNDAVDSNCQENGAITISGGDTEAVSFVGSPEEGFDCDFASIIVTGGRAVGIGGAMGPAPSAPSSETAKQPTLTIGGLQLSKGDTIEVLDSKGKAVLTTKVEANLRDAHMLLTCPDFKIGETYKIVSAGQTLREFTFNQSALAL